MARRRDPGMVTFDVSAGSAASSGSPDGGGAEVHGPRVPLRVRLVDRWRAMSRRRRALLAGGTAVVLVTAAGVAAAQALVTEQQRTERLRAAPGGVVSLDGELTEVWSAEVDGDVMAVLPDGGLLLPDGEAVRAVDVATGDERWRVELGEYVDCGPGPSFWDSGPWSHPVGVVTCLHGAEPGRSVTVLTAAGDVVGQRDLDPERYASAVPAFDGTLVVVEHDTGLPSTPQPQDPFVDDGDELAPASTAELWVEDAVTGEVRHHVSSASLEGTPLYECERHLRVDDEFIIDYAPWPPVATSSTVQYRYCGVSVLVLTDGTSLRSRELAADEGAWAPYPGGGWWISSGRPGNLFSADGTEVSMEGKVLMPRSTDGTHELVVTTTGRELTGAEPDGEVRWRQPLRDVALEALTKDTVLVSTTGGTIRALEAHDGSERWAIELADAEVSPSQMVDVWLRSTVTDGERVLVTGTELRDDLDQMPVPLAEMEDGDTEYVRSEQHFRAVIDLATGEWTRTDLGERQWPMALALDGHLVEHDVTLAEEFEVAVLRLTLLAPR